MRMFRIYSLQYILLTIVIVFYIIYLGHVYLITRTSPCFLNITWIPLTQQLPTWTCHLSLIPHSCFSLWKRPLHPPSCLSDSDFSIYMTSSSTLCHSSKKNLAISFLESNHLTPFLSPHPNWNRYHSLSPIWIPQPHSFPPSSHSPCTIQSHHLYSENSHVMESVYGFHSSLHKDPVPFPCHGLQGSASLAPVHLSRPICLYFLFAAWAVGTQVIIPGSFIIFRLPSSLLFPLLGALLLSSSFPGQILLVLQLSD